MELVPFGIRCMIAEPALKSGRICQGAYDRCLDANPPFRLRLVRGKAAVQFMDEDLTNRRAEFDAWRTVSESTDF